MPSPEAMPQFGHQRPDLPDSEIEKWAANIQEFQGGEEKKHEQEPAFKELLEEAEVLMEGDVSAYNQERRKKTNRFDMTGRIVAVAQEAAQDTLDSSLEEALQHANEPDQIKMLLVDPVIEHMSDELGFGAIPSEHSKNDQVKDLYDYVGKAIHHNALLALKTKVEHRLEKAQKEKDSENLQRIIDVLKEMEG